MQRTYIGQEACSIATLVDYLTTANVVAMFRALDVPAGELHIRNN